MRNGFIPIVGRLPPLGVRTDELPLLFLGHTTGTKPFPAIHYSLDSRITPQAILGPDAPDGCDI